MSSCSAEAQENRAARGKLAVVSEVASNLTELFCAALLAAGRPLTAAELATLLPDQEHSVEGVIRELQGVLSSARLGLAVDEVAGGYRLVVEPRLTPALAGVLAPPPLPRLSNAALETLALIAYRQPVTRGELEAARGASCSSTLETLQERDLIRSAGHRDVIGKPILWVTTDKFLIEFGLKSTADLPPLEALQTGFLRG